MIGFIFDTLRQNPELAIFLAIGLGYWIGAVKFGSFTLGSVTGTLLAGILVGQLGIEISPHVKYVFFMLFLFAVGYGVGPQFVRGVAKDGVPQALFAVVVCLLVLGSVMLATMLAGYDPGFAAGLHAGSQTISASIGLATDAINGLEATSAEKKLLIDHIPVAYAVTYIWGTVGTGWILATLGPKLLGVDLEAECRRYERELGAVQDGELTQSAWRRVEMRAYRIQEGAQIIGKSVGDAEREVRSVEGTEYVRLFVERIRRDGRIIDVTPSAVLRTGDVIAVSGRREFVVSRLPGTTEVDDRELLDVPVEAVDVVITRKEFDGLTLRELAERSVARGVFATRITRGAVGIQIPLLPETKLNRGDILRIVGARVNTDQLVAGARLRRPPDGSHGHDLGRTRDRDWRVDRRDRAAAGARTSDSFHLGRGLARGTGDRVVALGPPDLRPCARSEPVAHELTGPQHVHCGGGYHLRSDILLRLEGGGNQPVPVGSVCHLRSDAARPAHR